MKSGETVTVTFNVTVKDDLDLNTVTVIANKAILGDSKPEVEIPTGEVSLSSNKVVTDASGDGVASPGEVLIYTISSMNKGLATEKDVLIQDTLDGVLDYVQDPKAKTVTVDIDGIVIIKTVQALMDGFTITKLEPGQTVTITFEVIVREDIDLDTITTIANTAVIGDSKPEVEIPTGEVSLSSKKTVTDASGDRVASPGEVLTYTITSTNEGLATAKDVKIQDTLETVIPYVKDTASTIVNVDAAGTVSTKTIQELIAGFTIEELKSGKTVTVTFDVTVKEDLDLNAVTVIANKAVLGDTKPEVEIPTGEISLSSKKTVTDASGDEVASPGEVLTYTITSTNEGLATVKDIKIQDTLEAVIPYVKDIVSTTVKVDAAGTVTTKTIQELITGFTIEELKSGEVLTVTFDVTVKDDLDFNDLTTIANKAVIGDSKPEVEIPTGEVSLSSKKAVTDATGDGVASPGEVLTYTINSTNTGNATATNLLMKDTLNTVLPHVEDPRGNVVYVSINGVIVTTTTVQELINGFKIAKLEQDDTAEIKFSVTLKSNLDLSSVTEIVNQAVVGDTTVETSIPTGEAELVPGKTVTDANKDGIASPGEELIYSITALNKGTAPLYNIDIQDCLDSVLPYVEDPADNEVLVKINGTEIAIYTAEDLMNGFIIPELLPNEKLTITFKVIVSSDLDVTSVSHIANVAIVGETSPEIEIPTGIVDLENSKTVKDQNNDGFASPGEVLTYAITSTNKGSVAAKDIWIKDTLDSLLSHVNDPKANTVKVDVNGTVTTKNVEDLINGIKIAELKGGETVTITFEVTVKSDLNASSVTVIYNKATIDDQDVEIEIPTKSEEINYQVIYHGNGNTTGIEPVDNKLYMVDEKITIMNKGSLDNSGYKFVGWNTKADGTGTSYAVGNEVLSQELFDLMIAGRSITKNIHLYAMWEKTTTGGGGGGGTGTEVTKPKPTVPEATTPDDITIMPEQIPEVEQELAPELRPDSVPRTGDNSKVLILLCVMFSLSSLLLLEFESKKRKTREK